MRLHIQRMAGGGVGFVLAAGIYAWLAVALRCVGAPVLATDDRVPQAPPPNPPSVQVTARHVANAPRSSGAAYSIGNPTDEEQLYVEYINFTRANPSQEAQILATTTDPNVLSAYSYFSVNLNLMIQQFSQIAAAQPVSINPELTSAARLHTGDMFTNDFQSHTGSDGSNPFMRMTDAGYNYSAAAENIYAYAASVFAGEAGFEVDWGPGTGGMQTPPGHRDNTHDGIFREVGVGVIDGSNQVSTNLPVGPQVVTQDFGTDLNSPNTPFLTGVIYYDFAQSGFYSVGEGIGGVSVLVDGVTAQGVSATSGGYSVPLPGNGTYSVTFLGAGLSNQVTAVVSGGENVKVDYTPFYTPPAISGPTNIFLNNATTFSFAPVGGAQGYQFQASAVAPYTAVEGAENGLANVTAQVTGGYNVIQSATVYQGTHAFQLAHVAVPSPDQVLTLNPQLVVNSASVLTFYVHFGFATTNETAEAQVTADGGLTWQTMWTQTGTEGAGASGFQPQNVSLKSFAGKVVQIRFVYTSSGSSYTGPLSSVGVFLDNISVASALVLRSGGVTPIPSPSSFQFMAVSNATYALQVRAQLPGRTLNFGPVFFVTAGGSAPTTTITSIASPSAGQIQINFTPPASGTYHYQLLKTPVLGSAWTQDAAAVLTMINSSHYQFNTTVAPGSFAAFYKVAVSQ